MPKPKQPQKQSLIIRSLEELISDYDKDTLARALQSLTINDLGWQVLKAALMKEYLRTVAYQMDMCSKTGQQIEAAYYAGSAQTMFDTANSLIPQYVDLLQNRLAALQLENTRPTEE